VIQSVKARLKEIEKGLPGGVSIRIDYDRSQVIQEAVETLKKSIVEVFVSVSLIVLVFLFHWRCALVILIQIPISIAASFIVLNLFGISSNIMSLTGIILAIGVIVDDGIVMVENAHRVIAEEQ
jgi:Cu(I)/Ag(I) efflux system membrane protein CusA/SilA